jgi:hypothetical protein
MRLIACDAVALAHSAASCSLVIALPDRIRRQRLAFCAPILRLGRNGFQRLPLVENVEPEPLRISMEFVGCLSLLLRARAVPEIRGFV